jgi:hypothetical protein
MQLDDDDPLWEQHSSGDGHRGQEWGPGDVPLASRFYQSLAVSLRLILDLLMDRPREQVDSGVLASRLPQRGRSLESSRPVHARIAWSGTVTSDRLTALG